MSHTLTVRPNSVYTGQNITIDVGGLDVDEEQPWNGEHYDFGILRNGVTIYGYDPGSSPLVNVTTGPVSVTCKSAWLAGENDVLLTVRVYIFGTGAPDAEQLEQTLRLRKGEHVVPYTIDADVAALPVSGWLPLDSKRNNLNRLLFAHGVNAIKNPNGDLHFTILYAAPQDPEEIPPERIYATGGSETYEKPYSAISVAEHTYTPILDENPVTLFDNTDTDPVENKEIWFTQAPIIVTTIEATEGLSLIFATENSAVVSGTGKLTGIPYTHTTRVSESLLPGGDKERTVRVENCTMVNAINSANLLERLKAFFQPDGLIKTVKNSIVYTDQRAGKPYRLLSPFDEEISAWLTSMSINASEVFKANCEWRENYVPAGQEGLYTHCIILDKTTFAEDGGVFTVPAGAEQMKVVLIGGGTGGASGFPGEAGKTTSPHTNVSADADISGMWYGGEGGNGGKPGAGGAPGRVLSVTIEDPAASYSYTIGDGGAGGEASAPAEEGEEAVSNPGSAGTATTFGGYSTADSGSYVPEAGVYDPINGAWYALRGNGGISGGKGGARKVEADGYYVWVTDGEDVAGPDGTVYHGGRTGQPLTTVDGLPEARLTDYGGNGAGAAVGLDRSEHTEMDGGSDQTATWEVVENGV